MSVVEFPPGRRARGVAAVTVAATALKFLLELGALAALAYWGARTGPLPASIALAVGAPSVAALVWARWAAPQSAYRLPGAARIAVELGVFGVAALALVAAGAHALAELLIVLVLLDTWLLHRSRR
jgi:Protein of unknown function (DUF2568)